MGRAEIAGFRLKSYKTLQTLVRKTATFHHNINGMDVVPGRTIYSSASTSLFSRIHKINRLAFNAILVLGPVH